MSETHYMQVRDLTELMAPYDSSSKVSCLGRPIHGVKYNQRIVSIEVGKDDTITKLEDELDTLGQERDAAMLLLERFDEAMSERVETMRRSALSALHDEVVKLLNK